jgi:glycosyltransferase involved in cell wall biosynthesis
MAAPPDVSVVCPVYNEQDVLGELHERLVAALERTGLTFEIVFTNNASTDRSLAMLRDIAAVDRRVRVVSLSRNFGKQRSLTAGIDFATGRAVVLIDADLQDPPELIPDMVRLWREGVDMVYGQRVTREGEGRMKRSFTRVFYRLIAKLSDTPLPRDVGDFRLMDRKVVEALRSMREENRYLPGMVAWLGFRQSALPYERQGRPAGRTHFSPAGLFRFAMDGITSFSDRPLRMSSAAGALITLVSFLVTIWVVLRRLIVPDSTIPGFTAVLAAVLFIGGVQLLSIGLLGEYVGRIYSETKRRPLYVVDELITADQLDGSADGQLGAVPLDRLGQPGVEADSRPPAEPLPGFGGRQALPGDLVGGGAEDDGRDVTPDDAEHGRHDLQDSERRFQ